MPKEGAEKGIIAALEAKAQEHGIDIVDVEVVGATKNPCVRVRIDHADEQAPTITLDEVTAETGWISDAIDELDPFPAAFTLEGRRKFSGRLEGVEDGRVVLTCDAERVEVPLDEVKKCKVKPDFSNSGK